MSEKNNEWTFRPSSIYPAPAGVYFRYTMMDCVKHGHTEHLEIKYKIDATEVHSACRECCAETERRNRTEKRREEQVKSRDFYQQMWGK